MTLPIDTDSAQRRHSHNTKPGRRGSGASDFGTDAVSHIMAPDVWLVGIFFSQR